MLGRTWSQVNCGAWGNEKKSGVPLIFQAENADGLYVKLFL
jgi:hypothetical protein